MNKLQQHSGTAGTTEGVACASKVLAFLKGKELAKHKHESKDTTIRCSQNCRWGVKKRLCMEEVQEQPQKQNKTKRWVFRKEVLGPFTDGNPWVPEDSEKCSSQPFFAHFSMGSDCYQMCKLTSECSKDVNQVILWTISRDSLFLGFSSNTSWPGIAHLHWNI